MYNRDIGVLGVSAYFPVASNPTQYVSRMIQGWGANQKPIYSGRPVGQLITDLHDRSGQNGPARPVVFGEIGYAHCTNAAANPKAGGASCNSPDSKTAYRTQRRATQAAYCYWSQWTRDHNADWFHGFWWWAWDVTDSSDRSKFDVRSDGNASVEGRIRSWNLDVGEPSTHSCPAPAPN
jgi:hypothetical protein